MKHQTEQIALAERLKDMEPGKKRDIALLLYGFAAGIQSREALDVDKTA